MPMRVLLWTVLVILVSDAVLVGQCGWVLWQRSFVSALGTTGETKSDTWTAVDSFEQLAGCKKAIAERMRKLTETKTSDDVRFKQTTPESAFTVAGDLLFDLTHVCLPGGTYPTVK
jgi:hypothetical protein